jgi:hypothetical protein
VRVRWSLSKIRFQGRTGGPYSPKATSENCVPGCRSWRLAKAEDPRFPRSFPSYIPKLEVKLYPSCKPPLPPDSWLPKHSWLSHCCIRDGLCLDMGFLSCRTGKSRGTRDPADALPEWFTELWDALRLAWGTGQEVDHNGHLFHRN